VSVILLCFAISVADNFLCSVPHVNPPFPLPRSAQVVSEYEPKSLTEIAGAPTAALEGVSTEMGELLEKLGASTVAELGTFKYCLWAEAIVELADHEHTKTGPERTQETLLKRLE
jgi:hypothetical protein